MNTPEQTLEALAHEWDRAMVRNDAREIGRCMSDDWVIVGSDGAMTNKETFLAQIESGDLVRGRAFREYELQSNVFVKQGATWRCVFTHLSPLVESRQA